MVRAVTITMDGDEPTLVFSRLEDLPEALRVADEMGLPLTNPSDVDDDILALIRRAFAESRPLRTRVSGALHQPRFPPYPYPSRTGDCPSQTIPEPVYFPNALEIRARTSQRVRGRATSAPPPLHGNAQEAAARAAQRRERPTLPFPGIRPLRAHQGAAPFRF